MFFWTKRRTHIFHVGLNQRRGPETERWNECMNESLSVEYHLLCWTDFDFRFFHFSRRQNIGSAKVLCLCRPQRQSVRPYFKYCMCRVGTKRIQCITIILYKCIRFLLCFTEINRKQISAAGHEHGREYMYAKIEAEHDVLNTMTSITQTTSHKVP